MRLLRHMIAPPRFSTLSCLLAACLIAACGEDRKKTFSASDSAVEVASDAALDPTTRPPTATVPPSIVVPPPNVAAPLDSGLQLPDLFGMDAAVGTLDADTQVAPAGDATLPEVCTPDSSSPACNHPLRGRYAVRMVSYARQKTSVSGAAVDVINKGVLLSIADVSATGVVTEHLCAIELINADGLFSWTKPSATEKIPDSVAPLAQRDGGWVRTLASDRTPVAWSPQQQPADCTPGAQHSSGCTCYANDAFPTKPDDCRVTDLDGDGLPGVKLSVGVERPADLATAEGLFTVQVAAVKSIEWRLPQSGSDKLVGQVSGSIEQSQLSVAGQVASEVGKVRNASCPDSLGHVELVRGEFTCQTLLAGRAMDPDTLKVFDIELDAEPPAIEACPDPDALAGSDAGADAGASDAGLGSGVVADTGTPAPVDDCPADPSKVTPGLCGCGVADLNGDGDALPDCTDACPSDASKVAAGVCGCGVAETNADGDAVPDCNDGCPSDPSKVAAGTCGCGVSDTDTDSDATLDCRDGCPADPAKTAVGTCGCGVADRDLNGDGTVDCTDLCPADPAKVAPGTCGCGIADTNTDGDALPDCTDACAADPAKTAVGLCGCGAADTDGDGDGTPNCNDQCPTDPTRTAPGACGCQECVNPLVGTFAARSSLYGKQRTGSDPATTSKALGYSLITITANADGSLALSEKSCWSQTQPNPSESGLSIYSWVKPAWSAALPPSVRTLRPSGGAYTGGVESRRDGWDAARQPATCSASAAPPTGWSSSWGSTCRCSAPATSLPPYDRDTAPYDCRLTDADGDGYPGVSAFVSTNAPASPESEATGLLGARAFAATLVNDRWTVTAGTGGRHWGTIEDSSTSSVVGCTGGACAGLGSGTPVARACPAALNKVQLVPVTASSDTCAEIIAQRSSLFVTTEDGPWPSSAACPAP
jgi:hypothetical protein